MIVNGNGNGNGNCTCDKLHLVYLFVTYDTIL
jgi:hypothetical protein